MHVIILYIALALLLLVGTILLLPVKITVEYDTDLRLDASLLGSEDESRLFVTVKDIDAQIRRLAPILAKALGDCLALPSDLLFL